MTLEIEASLFTGLTVEAGFGLAVVASWWHERRGLRRFVTAFASGDVARLRGSADLAPRMVRPAASILVHGLRNPGDLDLALGQALAQLASSSLRIRGGASLFLDILLIVLAWLPAGGALVKAALGLAVALPAEATGARLYFSAIQYLPGTFAPLREAFAQTAMLAAGLALLFALRSWLIRAEAQEARALAALLEAVEASGRTLTSDSSVRLATAMSPRRGTPGVVLAASTYVLGVALAFGFLGLAAGLLRINLAQPPFAWPADRIRATGGQAEATLSVGGSPVATGPALIMGREQIVLDGVKIAALEAGALPKNFEQTATRVAGLPEQFQRSGGSRQLLVLADRDLPAQMVLRVLEHIRVDYGVTRFLAVVERRFGPVLVQAALRISLEDPGHLAAGVLRVAPAMVILGLGPGHRQLRLESDGWRREVQRFVHGAARLTAEGTNEAPNLSFFVEVDGEPSWRTLVAVLAAGDDVCDPPKDCGLPGLGLLYHLRPRTPSVVDHPTPEG